MMQELTTEPALVKRCDYALGLAFAVTRIA